MSDIHDDAAEEEVALVETLPIHTTYFRPLIVGPSSASLRRLCALGREKVLELPVIGNS